MTDHILKLYCSDSQRGQLVAERLDMGEDPTKIFQVYIVWGQQMIVVVILILVLYSTFFSLNLRPVGGQFNFQDH